ncbi:hypothetical protein [Ascidiaceihabitans sp.]|uniref:hypothetical protein n=1 Tax=Ascidiaceihabitans sp. TaxID=1872644 RepID=UPI003297634F
MRSTQTSDLGALNNWFQARGWPGISERHMQMKGFIVDDVAAGFLMQTDAGVAYLENYISNPDARPKQVATAIDQITAALLGLARAKGFEYVAAFTALPSIEKRAQRLGMSLHDEPYALLTKEL